MRDSTIKNVILGISVVIPLLVAILLFTPITTGIEAEWIKMLPALHALINSATAILLVAAVVSVSNNRVELHKKLMSLAFILGALFLLSYVLYHSSVDTVKFGDVDHDGMLSSAELDSVSSSRIIYLIILLSHIGLSVVVVPLVLFSFYYSLTGKIDKHKKIVKFTFPVWLYVSVTGVIVYFMISPYYF